LKEGAVRSGRVSPVRPGDPAARFPRCIHPFILFSIPLLMRLMMSAAHFGGGSRTISGMSEESADDDDDASSPDAARVARDLAAARWGCPVNPMAMPGQAVGGSGRARRSGRDAGGVQTGPHPHRPPPRRATASAAARRRTAAVVAILMVRVF
jgi:hypothetical protein